MVIYFRIAAVGIEEAVLKVVFTAKYTKKAQRSQNTNIVIPDICVLCEKSLRPLRLIFLTFETAPTRGGCSVFQFFMSIIYAMASFLFYRYLCGV